MYAVGAPPHRTPRGARAARRRTALIAVLALILAAAAALSFPPGARAATATTAITVDGASGGRTFDGVGAISGGGGNTRLLFDYPAAQRDQILDYLFKPGYGADLQMLKVEIGGDTNSTDGAEASHEHTQGTVDCNQGYEWWLMEQAKARNPERSSSARWPGARPAGSATATSAPATSIDYLVAWLGCATQHGLTIDYLGGWNEKGYNATWYENLQVGPGLARLHRHQDRRPRTTSSAGPTANDTRNAGRSPTPWTSSGVHYPCGYRSGAEQLLPAPPTRAEPRQAAVGQRERLGGLRTAGAAHWPAASTAATSTAR